MKYGGHTNSRGFTLVELLIAIVVIAVLATITTIAFQGMRARAVDTAIKNDFSRLAKEIKLYQAEHGRLPGVIGGSQGQIDQVRYKPTHSAYSTDVGNLYVCFGGSWGQTPNKDTHGFRALDATGKHHVWRSDLGHYYGPETWPGHSCGELVNGGAYMFVVGRNTGNANPANGWTTSFR